MAFRGAPRCYGHKIPLWSGREWLNAGPVLLAGDAAGLADPLFGEGIAFAIRSGQVAAATLTSYLAGESESPDEYTRTIHATLGRDLDAMRWLDRPRRSGGSRRGSRASHGSVGPLYCLGKEPSGSCQSRRARDLFPPATRCRLIGPALIEWAMAAREMASPIQAGSGGWSSGNPQRSLTQASG